MKREEGEEKKKAEEKKAASRSTAQCCVGIAERSRGVMPMCPSPVLLFPNMSRVVAACRAVAFDGGVPARIPGLDADGAVRGGARGPARNVVVDVRGRGAGRV